jgi:hypothetical protein
LRFEAVLLAAEAETGIRSDAKNSVRRTLREKWRMLTYP